MNEMMESKLLNLIEDAKQQNLPAVHVVLHMLVGAHTNGTQREFAKWCCQFSPFQMPTITPEVEVYEEFPTELDMEK